MKDLKTYIKESTNDDTFTSKDGKFKLDDVINKLSDLSRSTGNDEVVFGCYSYTTKDVGLPMYVSTDHNIIKFEVNQDNKLNKMKYNEFIKILDSIDDKNVMFTITNKEKAMKSKAVVNTVKKFKIYESLGKGDKIQFNFEIL